MIVLQHKLPIYTTKCNNLLISCFYELEKIKLWLDLHVWIAKEKGTLLDHPFNDQIYVFEKVKRKGLY